MRTVTLILAAFLLFSCSAEDNNSNTTLPDKFTGLWFNLTEETIADVQSNKIVLEIEENEDILFDGFRIESETLSQINLINAVGDRIQLTLAQDRNYMWILYEREGNVTWNRLYERVHN